MKLIHEARLHTLLQRDMLRSEEAQPGEVDIQSLPRLWKLYTEQRIELTGLITHLQRWKLKHREDGYTPQLREFAQHLNAVIAITDEVLALIARCSPIGVLPRGIDGVLSWKAQKDYRFV